MAEATEQKIKIRDCEAFLRRGGSGDPVLFLHGAGGVPGWIPSFEKIADSHDLLVPDHPGFGQSDQPDWLDDMNDMALFYLDFLKEQGLENVHLAGQSLGGWIALEMAVRSTHRIRSLTLVGAAGIRIKGKPIADIFMMDPEEMTRSLFVDQSFADRILNANLTEEQQDIQIRNRVTTARLGWQPRLFNPSLRKWMHRVDVPTHIIWGDQDKIVDPAYGPEFQSLITGSELTVIKDAGHLPHIETADAFADAFTGFLAKN